MVKESGPEPGGTGSGSAVGFATLIFTGSLLVGCIGTGLGLGYLVDQWTHTTPLFVFVGLFFGILAASAGTYRAVRDYLNQ